MKRLVKLALLQVVLGPAASWAQIISVCSLPFSPDLRFQAVVDHSLVVPISANVNDLGSVVFLGTIQVGPAAGAKCVYFWEGDTPEAVACDTTADPPGPYTLLDGIPALNNLNHIAFWAQQGAEQKIIFTKRQGSTWTQTEIASGFFERSPMLSDADHVAYIIPDRTLIRKQADNPQVATTIANVAGGPQLNTIYSASVAGGVGPNWMPYAGVLDAAGTVTFLGRIAGGQGDAILRGDGGPLTIVAPIPEGRVVEAMIGNDTVLWGDPPSGTLLFGAQAVPGLYFLSDYIDATPCSPYILRENFLPAWGWLQGMDQLHPLFGDELPIVVFPAANGFPARLLERITNPLNGFTLRVNRRGRMLFNVRTLPEGFIAPYETFTVLTGKQGSSPDAPLTRLVRATPSEFELESPPEQGSPDGDPPNWWEDWTLIQLDLAQRSAWVDPPVSTGYDYALGDGVPNVQHLIIPRPLPLGDSSFELVIGKQTFPLLAGQGFDAAAVVPGGIRQWTIRGIDPAELLVPGDPAAFVTGLTFMSSVQIFRMTMTAHTLDTDADSDGDGALDGSDNCRFHASASQADTDADGRGNECECGDQNGDGLNTVSDLVAINIALFNPAQVTPLCDANNSGTCTVSDIVAVNADLFQYGSVATCARQPLPGP